MMRDHTVSVMTRRLLPFAAVTLAALIVVGSAFALSAKDKKTLSAVMARENTAGKLSTKQANKCKNVTSKSEAFRCLNAAYQPYLAVLVKDISPLAAVEKDAKGGCKKSLASDISLIKMAATTKITDEKSFAVVFKYLFALGGVQFGIKVVCL